MKKLSFWIIYICILVIVFFVMGEICFRIFRGSPNRLIETTQQQSGTLFAANTIIHSASSKEGEFVYDARINNYGYRGADFLMPKPAGTLRLFFIGDSYTFGVGAQDNETIPYLVSQKLIEDNPDIEVVNAGVGHTGPAKHYINLRNIHLQYQPDAVVLVLDMTDIWDDWDTERHGVFDKNGELLRFDPYYKNGQYDWWAFLATHSAFCQYLHNKVVRSFIKMKHLGFKRYMQKSMKGERAKAVIANDPDISDDIKMEYDGLLMLRGSERADMITRQWQRTAKYILKIKNLLNQQGIPLVLVMYPHGIYVGAEEWTEGRGTWGFEQHKKYTDYFPFELVKSWANENDVPFINTLDNFLAAPSDQKYFYNWDGHMTPAGYRIVAEAIEKSPNFANMVNAKMKAMRAK